MSRIPKKLREKMAADPFYYVCCITGERSTWGDKVEWHHNLIVARRQVQLEECILPLKKSLHDRVHEPWLRDRVDWIMLNRMSDAQIAQFSKAVDYATRKRQLNALFGVWNGCAVAATTYNGINYGACIA